MTMVCPSIGNFIIFSYNDEGELDAGWGCTYRNIQTVMHSLVGFHPKVSDIRTFFNLTETNIGNNLWLEPQDVCKYLNFVEGFKVSHWYTGSNHKGFFKRTSFKEEEKLESEKFKEKIKEHFKHGYKWLILDDGICSYAICCFNDKDIWLCDPHRNEKIIKLFDFNMIDAVETWCMACVQ